MPKFLTCGLLLLLPCSVALAKDKPAVLKMPRYVVTGFVDQDSDRAKSIEGRALTTKIEQPLDVDLARAKKFFDLSRALPEPTAEELQYEEGSFSKNVMRTRNITEVFTALYNKKFSDPKYGQIAATDAWVGSFGEIMSHFRDIKGKAAETKAALKFIREKYPIIWKDLAEVLPSLVQNDFLYSGAWNPWKEESSDGANNDGLFFLPYWKIRPVASRNVVWRSDLSDPKVYQGGVVIFGALDDIKRVERDYRLYPKHVKMGYLAAAPLENSYWVGVDEQGNEFTALEVFFRQDLPFPYDSTRYAMKLFDHYNGRGFYVSDYYSSNRVDLYWMAGRDTFFPLKDAKGETFGYLIGTELGFDIRNLPEGDKDRLLSIRGSWGNIKRIVEGLGPKS